jgi:hypothetical protein
MGTRKVDQTPIGFNVQKQNITRAVNLETVKHYNFGVWAYKVNGKNNLADEEVMNHYLVGWSGTIGSDKKGYNVDNNKTTTYATTAGTTVDHTSPWFYEGLGTAEYNYEGSDGFYKKTNADYMSKNVNQYLRYWDLAYVNTNFYCYAPYNKNVSFEYNKTDHTAKMTFPATTSIRDGYDEPQNTTYSSTDRSLSEYMYATNVQATNAQLADVTVPFKHMGAQLFIRFYEDIPNYKVEIIDLNADRGTSASTDYDQNGIQAAPAIAPTSGTNYTKGTYYTTNGAELTFDASASTTFTPNFSSATSVGTPLMFKIPQADLSTDNAAYCPSNLTAFAATTGNTTSHNVIKEKTSEGTQEYSYSPTIYYPVAQPTTSTTGFTFHISYRVIAEDNGEVITVHNATVHVPYKGDMISTDERWDPATKTHDAFITVWQPNVKYTYTFRFTKNTTGKTNPDTDIDPTDPTPSTTTALYPIVFDAATIEDYTNNYSEYIVSDNTGYNQTVTP